MGEGRGDMQQRTRAGFKPGSLQSGLSLQYMQPGRPENNTFIVTPDYIDKAYHVCTFSYYSFTFPINHNHTMLKQICIFKMKQQAMLLKQQNRIESLAQT